MMIRRILYIILMFSCFGLSAQETVKIGNIVVENDTVSVTETFLDSVDVKKKVVINDYDMIGVQYGVNMNGMTWNPSMRSKTQIVPLNFGVTYTKYCKMFGYMPFFGLQAGLLYSREGYRLDEGYGVTDGNGVTISDAAMIDVVEVPVLAHFHFDFWKMKLMANIGFYGSYRLAIRRFGENVPQHLENSFLDTDIRWDYGIKGGAGFGFVFDPVELHFNAMYKYGFGNLYQPDYSSKYYYKFATVSNFTFSVSLHFQITKRIGKTRMELKREARRQIKEENNGHAGHEL